MPGSADSAIGVLGVATTRADTTAQHDPGLEVNTIDGKAIYARAVLAAPAGSLCTIAPSSAAASVSVLATLVSTGNINSAPGILAINQVSVAASSWGWFYTEASRRAVVRVATGCEPLVPLYTTTTGGVVDDAVVSAGRIEGLRIMESAASASTPPAVFHNMTRITQDIA